MPKDCGLVIKNCEEGIHSETCQMSTQATVSLENIDFQHCVWFHDENKNTFFSLAMKLKKITCAWSTQRRYYTFPTEAKSVTQVACSQNYLCGWGEHCRDGKRFPAETRESQQYPGVNRCIAIDSGSSSCYIIDSQPCLFYRAFLVPDYLHTYEVRTITGYSCSYDIEVQENINGSIETTMVRHAATTKSGIRLQVLGAFDQPAQLLQTALISRVGNPQESYLDHAAPAGAPANNMIGHVQANGSLVKNFIFNEDIIECNAYEENLHCRSPEPYLKRMVETKQHALPRTIGYHFFYLDPQERLTSDLLFTSPVNIQMTFEDYSISIERRTVCPKFTTDPLKASGCFACAPLAAITFTAFSTCAEGIVSVVFERIMVATRTIRLTTSPQEHVIEFKGEVRCITDKLCLNGRTVHACQPITFCLDTPHIELMHPNMSAFQLLSGNSANFLTDWRNWIPGSLFTSWWKIFIIICVIIFMSIFMISTFITCVKG